MGQETHDMVAFIRDMPDDLREIVALLLRNPEGLWFNEIHRRLRKKIGSPTTLCKRLKELIDMGLIERVKGPRKKSIYRLKPWFLRSFHRLFLLGAPGLDADEEASFLMELPAVFVSAKEVAERLEELLTGEFLTEEFTEEGRVKIERYKYGPEEKDIEVLKALLWLSRAIIDAVAYVLILGAKNLDRTRELIMESVDEFLRALSECSEEIDRVKWGDVWHFLNDEWLKYYIAISNWLTPKLRGEEYPTPIATAHPERERVAITPFGMVWRSRMWLTMEVMRAQALSLVFSRESVEFYKKLNEEIEKLLQEHPELVGTKEWAKRISEIVDKLRKEFKARKKK